MRYFEKFPNDKECPICGTNKDGQCFLMPMDGTESGNICEAAPTHRECVSDEIASGLRYNQHHGIIYFRDHKNR